MNDVEQAAWASVKFNGDFILVETYSGYRLTQADPKGVQHSLQADVSDEDLGRALQDALAHSRFVLPEPRQDVWIHPQATFDKDLYDFDANNQRYEAWVTGLLAAHGYKTKRALFKNMKCCNVQSQQGRITLRPTCHEKLEAWSGKGISANDHVEVDGNATLAELGAAVRLALSRCVA